MRGDISENRFRSFTYHDYIACLLFTSTEFILILTHYGINNILHT